MSDVVATPAFELDVNLGDVRVSQEQICAMEDVLKEGPTIEPVEEHYFASGVYARVLKAPAGSYVVGKAHKTEHLCIMLKGSISVTGSDGSIKVMTAPAIFTVPGGQKKFAYVAEEMWFVNVHGTDSTDLVEIEKQFIIPEDEFRTTIGYQPMVGLIKE